MKLIDRHNTNKSNRLALISSVNIHIILLLTTIISLFKTLSSHNCGVEYLKAKRELTTPLGDQNQRYLSTTEFEPIRIHLDFSFIENHMNKFNKQDLIDLKEKIMPKTKEVFEKILKVKRIDGKLKFDSTKCDEFNLPETYTADGEGVDADLLIFVMIDDTGFFKENGIEAAAIHCLQHGATRRPIAGYIQFKPELRVTNSTALDYQVWLALHEITHVLVMNDSLYPDFVNSNNEVIGKEKIVGSREVRKSENNRKFRVQNNLGNQVNDNFKDSFYSTNLPLEVKNYEKERSKRVNLNFFEGVSLLQKKIQKYKNKSEIVNNNSNKNNIDQLTTETQLISEFNNDREMIPMSHIDLFILEKRLQNSNNIKADSTTNTNTNISKPINTKKDTKQNKKRVTNYYLDSLTYELMDNETLLTPTENAVNKVNFHIPLRTNVNNKSKIMTFLKSPKILEKAKSHFNCDSVEGIPLEYNGGQGTNGAHWAKRYMNTDYMIGDSYGENLISDITLALFEDSGWYKVDYSMSNLFLWGKNTGCDFLQSNCVNPKFISKEKNSSNSNVRLSTIERTSATTDFPNEFCTEASAPVCSTHNIFRGVCAIKKYQFDLPSNERHFPDSKVGGIDRLADKCPIPIEAKRGQVFYGGSCREGVKAYEYETISSEAACFITNLKVSDNRTTNQSSFLQIKRDDEDDVDTLDKEDLYSKNGYVASCLKFSCSGNKLSVIIGKDTYECNSENKIVNINGYNGKIQCPSREKLCHEKFKCKFGCTEKFSTKNEFFSYNFK